MGALNSLASMGLNLALSQQAAGNERKELRDDRDQQIRQIQLNDAEDRRLREATLRRRLAQERARAGAAGTGTSGGSADAILRGLQEESRAAQRSQDAESAGRIGSIRQTYQDRRRRNLLDFSGSLLGTATQALGGSGSGRRSLLD